MSVYICEDFAEENNNYDWKHQDNCLLCKLIEDTNAYMCDECYYIDPDDINGDDTKSRKE